MHALLSVLTFAGATNAPYCRPDVFRPPAAPPFGSASVRHRVLRCLPYLVRTSKGLLSLSVATDQKDRERGLMAVRVLPARVGMIFKFAGGDGMRAFWMKDTLIPLDMVFVRADGSVSDVAENVPATTSATPDAQIPRRYGVGQYVIELNAGEAARDGIAPGVRLILPRLGAA